MVDTRNNQHKDNTAYSDRKPASRDTHAPIRILGRRSYTANRVLEYSTRGAAGRDVTDARPVRASARSVPPHASAERNLHRRPLNRLTGPADLGFVLFCHL